MFFTEKDKAELYEFLEQKHKELVEYVSGNNDVSTKFVENSLKNHADLWQTNLNDLLNQQKQVVLERFNKQQTAYATLLSDKVSVSQYNVFVQDQVQHNTKIEEMITQHQRVDAGLVKDLNTVMDYFDTQKNLNDILKKTIDGLVEQNNLLKQKIDALDEKNVIYDKTLAKYAELSHKYIKHATRFDQGVPYGEIVAHSLDDKGQLKAEMDWNKEFIASLISKGFVGKNDNEIIQQWLYFMLQQFRNEQTNQGN